MSIAARDWAYSQCLPMCQKFVLVALAERANENGVAWPSVKTLAEMTGGGEKTVRRALKQMLDDGVIVLLDGKSRPKVYQIPVGNKVPLVDSLTTYEKTQPVTQSTLAVTQSISEKQQPVTQSCLTVTQSMFSGHSDHRTVRNRQEPNISVTRSDATGEDWVDAKYVSLGDEVLSIAGHNPAQTKIDYGEIRQWLADARKIGHGFDAARDVILAVIREKCDRYSGRGKYPKWFRVPVAEALRSGCTKSSVSMEIVDKPIKDAYREHVNFLIKRGEKYKTYDEFAADWRERHAA
ncbi:helix-turn-helix domain-containing protein [Acetobacter senegalensis]|uniref:helix-turn-helix domain-containing protein n=1 Tax=Acetobacter senegalensis TaxID=446692 RepID=UPI001EE0650C|nr:helix-turn-helix domain-containing protein [Acetobacter senegalensis]MCG4273915.1 helix-turn-helix domain-containing protein [Acetobacter senegalensis]